jgi:uncharacterized protein
MVAGAVGVGGYTRYYEPTWLEITTRAMPIAGLPRSLVGKRLVQLSDIHLGPHVKDAYVFDTFARVRALDPDLVVYTGDLTSLHPGLYEHAAHVYGRMPRGALGTFVSLGNHDYGRNWAHKEDATRIADVMRAQGATVLVNEMAEVDGLAIVGLGDLWGDDFAPDRAFAHLTPGRAAIALSHNPDTVDMNGWERFSGWVLAGHTHGGQCKPPFLPPPILPVKNKRYTCGEFALSAGRQLYISRGIGTVLPVRFNVRPEVTVFRLTAA